MLTGFPSASSGVRFLLNFLPPMKGLTKMIKSSRRFCNIPPLVGLLNFPARPLLPGGMMSEGLGVVLGMKERPRVCIDCRFSGV